MVFRATELPEKAAVYQVGLQLSYLFLLSVFSPKNGNMGPRIETRK